jgi:hypothetical protein
MHPLALEVADTFWEGSLAAAARGERIVLGAFPFRFYRNGKALVPRHSDYDSLDVTG